MVSTDVYLKGKKLSFEADDAYESVHEAHTVMRDFVRDVKLARAEHRHRREESHSGKRESYDRLFQACQPRSSQFPYVFNDPDDSSYIDESITKSQPWYALQRHQGTIDDARP